MATPEARGEPDFAHEVRAVGWLELFYDLVFVAAITTFSDAVSFDPEPPVIATVVAAYAAVWWIWLATTLYTNRFRVDDGLHRALVLAQMVLLTMAALTVGDGIGAHEGLFSVVYGLLVADLACMYGRSAATGDPNGAFARARRNAYALATVPIFASALVGGPGRYVLWAAGFAIVVVPALGERFERGPNGTGLDEHHLVERFGLLTIIVCGESFVKVSLLAADGSLEDLDLVVLSALFMLVFSMWWAYFDDIPESGLPATPARVRSWFLGHLFLQVSLIGIAVGFAKLLPLTVGDAVDGDRVLLGAGPLVGIYLALALIGACTRRTPRRPLLLLRLGSAVFVVAVGVAIWRIDWIDVESAAIVLALIALAHGALSNRLRQGTLIAEEPPTPVR